MPESHVSHARILESDARRTRSVGGVHVPHVPTLSLWRMCDRISSLAETVSAAGAWVVLFVAFSVGDVLVSES